MHIFRPHWYQSIAFKLVAPIVGVGAIIALVVLLVFSRLSATIAQYNTSQEAESIMETIIVASEIDSDEANLIRLVNALGASRDIQVLYMFNSPDMVVLGSTENQYIGKRLRDVDQLTQDFVKQFADVGQNQLMRSYTDELHSYLQVTKLLDPKRSSFRDVLVVMHFKPVFAAALATQARNVVAAIFIAGLVTMILVTLWTQRRLVVKPLTSIVRQIAHSEEKDFNTAVTHQSKDEFQSIVNVYNHVSKVRIEALHDLFRALGRAESASQAKTLFLSNMSHELRTPLNSVIGFSNRILKHPDNLNQRQLDAIEAIARNGKHLLSLINDVLDLSKIDAGKMEINPQPFNITSLCRECVDSFLLAAREKCLELSLEVADDVMIVADSVRIKQIVLNLVSNAIKYTDKGSVKVSVSKNTVTDQVTIAVADSGIGIRQEDQQRLFKRFEQFDDNSRFNIGMGTGLGLSIVAEFAKLHGGKVDLVSEYNVGSCFTVTLPLKTRAQAA